MPASSGAGRGEVDNHRATVKLLWMCRYDVVDKAVNDKAANAECRYATTTNSGTTNEMPWIFMVKSLPQVWRRLTKGLKESPKAE